MRTDEMRAPHLPPPSKRAVSISAQLSCRSSNHMQRTKAKVYLPPAPKRATIASQQRQFKKLIAPFRSPLRLSPAVDGPSQVVNNRDLEPTIIPECEWSRADPDRKESDKHLTTSQRKSAVPKTLRAAAQFKSPLIDSGATLTDCRGTIRLTPTIQTLERKLQLLKRAVQVKENNEDEILSRVAKKWTEAAREVAYEVWGIIGDSANIVDGAKSFGGSWGWDGDDNRDAKWGWDTKIEDTSGELGNYDLPEAPDSTKRLALEGEVDERASLATMLRQLGITPETLGWDNDRETFLD
ncbi:hypothetical protein BDN67DRAFT_240406 [Paxillus ammoniavirescens]|nr:hypothetical protein BDN67DRAFT_240406 [Paxillus ammoniavirescens]